MSTLYKVPNADLTGLNTLGFVSTASFLFKTTAADDLHLAAELAAAENLPLILLGGGSNIILPRQLKAVVVQQQPQPLAWPEELPDNLQLKVPAGNNWHQLVLDTANKGYFGIENLALIPGQVGAAPIQNIGAYGVELSDCLAAVEGFWLEDGKLKQDILPAKDCGLGYRTSHFKGKWKGKFIITALYLNLSRTAKPNLGYADLHPRLDAKQQEAQAANFTLPRLIAEVIRDVRQEKLPNPEKIGNVGSFFKNPLISPAQAEELKQTYPDLPTYPAPSKQVKLAAAWLIESCGFKGKLAEEFTGLGVHSDQALVLVHTGGADAEQLLKFANKIQQAVAKKFNVQLEIEPEIL